MLVAVPPGYCLYSHTGTPGCPYVRHRADFSGADAPGSPEHPEVARGAVGPDCRRSCPAELYWTAPELLRLPEAPWAGTPKGDVYSFAVLMRELIHQQDRGPFADLDGTPGGKSGSAPRRARLSGVACKCLSP